MQQAEQNYLYILFAVLYIIYGIVKALRKKQLATVPKPEFPTHSQDAERTDNPEESVSAPTIKAVKRKLSNKQIVKKEKPIIPLYAHGFVAENTLTKTGDDITEDREANTEIDFDLRNAILYSEILKRPQY
ncbi:MAG TPA: hypothetical protein PKO16_06430 [Bacteroidia bacterium]|nr:hypothetical protein [Bacteroidia bacterium]